MAIADRKKGQFIVFCGLIFVSAAAMVSFYSGIAERDELRFSSSVEAVDGDIEEDATTAESINGDNLGGGLTEPALEPSVDALLYPATLDAEGTTPIPGRAPPEADPFAEMQRQIDDLRREHTIEDVRRRRQVYLAVDAAGLDADVAIKAVGGGGSGSANVGQLSAISQALAGLSGGQGPAPSPDVEQIRANGGRDSGTSGAIGAGLQNATTLPAQSNTPTAAVSSGSAGGFGTGSAVQEVVYARNTPFAPLSPYELKKGSFIPAILITEIVSDNPGSVIAQTTMPIFDSVTGTHMLIPRGSKLSGRYSSDVSFGTERIGVVWNHLIFPDGRTLVLEGAPGATANGSSGLKDQIDTRFFETFGLAVLTSLIGVGVELISPEEDGDVGRLADELRRGVGENVGSAIDGYVRRNIDLAPRITIRSGLRFNIMVERDFIVPPA